MNTDSKRGQNVALLGLALQTALAAVYCTVWLLTGAAAAQGVFALNACGSVIWAMTAVIFYSRRLAEMEVEEIEQLNAGGSSTVFGEQGGIIPLAQRRLALIRRVFSPIVGLLLGAGLVALGVWLERSLRGSHEAPGIDRGLMWAFFCLGSAFLGFLFSRYALGMAKDPTWRLLRAGGGFMTVGTLAGGLLCTAFFLNHLDIAWALPVLPYVVLGLIVVLGVEMLAHVVLDFYRPRRPDTEPRPSFDSRLANLISEPGSIAHSIADALNYQFGFEVSSTWFYELLRRTLVPLVLFGIVALVAVSAIVVVHPGQRAVVLTWGKAPPSQAVLEPGLYLKWPWPVQTADIIDAERIRSFEIGVEHTGAAHDEDDGHGHDHDHTPAGFIPPKQKIDVPLVLWAVAHDHAGAQEIDFLTARRTDEHGSSGAAPHDPLTCTIPGHVHVLSPAAGDDGHDHDHADAAAAPVAVDRQTAESAAAFGLIRMVFAVQYRVKDVYAFHYGAADAPELLKRLALRAATHLAASQDVDEIMQSGGDGRIVRQLEAAIARQADALDLGVEIVAVSLRGVHPPPKIADAFEEVIMAQQEMEGARLTAETRRDTILSTVAGSTEKAYAIDGALRRIRQLRDRSAEEHAVEAAMEEARRQLAGSGGEVRVLVNEALAERWRMETIERSRWAALEAQMAAFEAAPRLYALEGKLDVLSGALQMAPRKYLLGLDKEFVEVRVDDDRSLVGGSFDPGSN
ncbi:MAG: hypothetical protein GX591_11445 [Planctomycetes bacterium]|nr:hypothetical protein [Planctomycetota bacterium]